MKALRKTHAAAGLDPVDVAIPESTSADVVTPTASEYCGATPLEWSIRLSRSAIERLGNVLTFGESRATLDYSNDLFAISLLGLAERAGDSSLRGYGENIVGSFVAADGSFRAVPVKGFRLDAMPAGQVLIDIYKRTGDERYRKAAGVLRARLADLPRTGEGVFSWAPNQIWLDGMWMTQPFYARYAKEFGEPADFDDILKQYQLVTTHNRDARTGLYFHGWDEPKQAFWANRETGTSSSFWARAIGWFAMSIVDVLDSLPQDSEGHRYLVGLLNDLAPALVRFQDPSSGLWWQVVDQGSRPGNYTESSASSIFVYTLAKGVNRGYLKADLAAPALKAYAGLVRDKIVKDAQGGWSLIDIVRSAGLGPPPSEWPPGMPAPSRRDTLAGGRDGSFDYYVEQPVTTDNLHGLGPFILAGIEVDRLVIAGAVSRAPGPACTAGRR